MRAFPRRLRPLDASGAAYVVLIALWLLLRLIWFDRLWWLALVNTFALALFLPLVLLLPLALWRRRRRLLVGLLLPLAAFGWLFGDLLLPQRALSPASPTITAMSFNVLWSNDEYGRIADAIQAAAPDLVALQELRPQHLPAIQDWLATPFPYQAIHPVDQFHTIGLLSRFPIEAVTPLDDPPFERALRVRLRAGARPLTVIVAHLTPTNMLDRGLAQLPAVVAERYARREAQATALVSAAQENGQPTLVLCDCNLTDTSAAYATLRAGLGDSFAEAGWGLGLTMLLPQISLPAQRYDYIWHSADLVAIAAHVGVDGGSDHLPVVARFTWR
jgi:endonuclease/exonuclease/phosphatase (EEP) superfamily protein YafD